MTIDGAIPTRKKLREIVPEYFEPSRAKKTSRPGLLTSDQHFSAHSRKLFQHPQDLSTSIRKGREQDGHHESAL